MTIPCTLVAECSYKYVAADFGIRDDRSTPSVSADRCEGSSRIERQHRYASIPPSGSFDCSPPRKPPVVVVGHRALVADARTTAAGATADDFVVWYSHWGAHEFQLWGALVDASSPPSVTADAEAPASCTEPNVARRTLGTTTDVAGFASEFVDPIPHEAAFVVSPDATVTAFLPLAAAVGPGTVDAGGVLLALRDDPHPALDAQAVRAWARENRPASRHPANAKRAPAPPGGTLDRFHDAVTDAFPDRESFRIPVPLERTPPSARGPMTPGD